MKRIGDSAHLTYDAPDRRVRVGDVIRTTTGRCYNVVSVRVQERGKHAGRYHLQCVVVDAPLPGQLVHPLYWHKRG